MAKNKKAKKRVACAEEIANDPSLRLYPYRQNEMVWSDTLATEMRFYEYIGEDKARLAAVNSMEPLDIIVPILSIRRPSVMGDRYAGWPCPNCKIGTVVYTGASRRSTGKADPVDCESKCKNCQFTHWAPRPPAGGPNTPG